MSESRAERNCPGEVAGAWGFASPLSSPVPATCRAAKSPLQTGPAGCGYARGSETATLNSGLASSLCPLQTIR